MIGLDEGGLGGVLGLGGIAGDDEGGAKGEGLVTEDEVGVGVGVGLAGAFDPPLVFGETFGVWAGLGCGWEPRVRLSGLAGVVQWWGTP